MTENLGRKTTLVVVVTLLALASILYFPLVQGKAPFRLGLDLQGGTRMVFRFDFEAAVQAGSISREELNDKALLLQETADIIRGRVDPKGVMELTIRTEGEDRLVIELPGAAAVSGVEVNSKLAKPLSADATAEDGRTIELDPTNNSGKNEEIRAINAFPVDGGELRIGTEKILYNRRVNAVLYVTQRGDAGTTIAAHAAGDVVELLTTDDLIRKIMNVGDMHFYLAALSSDFTALGTDEQTERKKVEDWQTANPNSSIDEFNRLSKDKGGPPEGLLWFPHRPGADELVDPNVKRPLVALVVPRPTDPTEARDAWVFSGKDLAAVGFDTDPNSGYPAVRFATTTEKAGPFGDFTKTNIDRGMAIVMNGEIITLANINDRLPGSGIITGGGRGFTPKEVNDLISVLRSGSLRIKPILLDQSRVGASLGDAYVVNALYSTIAALGLIVAFMVLFYRRLGLFSVVGLVINLVLLMGTLAFLQATLTLPGVAGIILTLGMAVDGNILIFERLREESARGLKLIQAVKAAFERAAVTILDSNITTLIAGVILYFVGTGAIRGFATTLNIGILSTLFTVIVVSQVFVLTDVKRGRTKYSMIKVLEKPKIRFMNAARIAIPISVAILVAGVALFAWLPDSKKLGIDFLGGFAVTVRTQEPQKEDTIRDLVGKIQGTIGESAQIQAVTDSGDKAKGYTTWRITFKLQGDETTGEADIGERGLKEIQNALEPVLQRGPVEVKLEPGEGVQKVEGELYLEDSHNQDDIAKALASAKVRNAKLTPLPAGAKGFAFTAETDSELTASEIVSAVTQAFTGFRDSRSVAYRLMTPIPESTFVGAQVGGELRDRAVRALLLGMLGSILYLRIRFAEYSFGVGVVVAVAHDVLIALGGIAVACATGIVQAELDLSMIAAFLTIIGYSQNDTIVIFDRVRENLPKSKKPLRDILDDSINETLGRTILTTCTVFLTLLVLFLFNVGSRNVLEGFSFIMLVGVISGCYSTIYVASPVLLWFDKLAKKREQKNKDNAPKDTPAAVSS